MTRLHTHATVIAMSKKTISPASALAKLRWAKYGPEERSEHMRQLALRRAKKLGKKAMREISAKGGRAGKGVKKPRKSTPEAA